MDYKTTYSHSLILLNVESNFLITKYSTSSTLSSNFVPRSSKSSLFLEHHEQRGEFPNYLID